MPADAPAGARPRPSGSLPATEAPLPRPLATLLAGAVDWAGLFPPAALGMAQAALAYAEYLGSRDRWALGRFVVPAALLEELRAAAAGVLPAAGAGEPWRLSALLGEAVERDVGLVLEHNRTEPRAVVDAVEVRVGAPAAARALRTVVPEELEVYAEVPLEPDPAPLLEALAELGWGAKARTGGVSADAFPTAERLARFLVRAADAGVPFKLTAGLHHPLRGEHPLTYEPGSARSEMFGYLNALLASALALEGAGVETVASALEEREAAALTVQADALVWRDRQLDVAALAAARARGMRGFGSCSFREPVDELGALARGAGWR